jgi:hypothetical protein
VVEKKEYRLIIFGLRESDLKDGERESEQDLITVKTMLQEIGVNAEAKKVIKKVSRVRNKNKGISKIQETKVGETEGQ